LQLTTTGSTNQTLYCQYIVTRKSAVRRTQQGNLPWNDFWTDRQTDRQTGRQTDIPTAWRQSQQYLPADSSRERVITSLHN